MAENKPNTPASIAEELTPKNREFIYLLVHGKSESGNPLTVYEAYQKAGYEGSFHAAYQLKSRLEKEIMLAEVNRGASKADIFRQIANLMTLPITDTRGNPAAGITVGNKIKLLQLAVKAHEAVEPTPPKITAFTINMAPAPAQGTVVEAEVVKGETDERTGSNPSA